MVVRASLSRSPAVIVLASACSQGGTASEGSGAVSVGETVGDTGHGDASSSDSTASLDDTASGGPGCDDAVMNGDETDVDCGGSCPPCGNGHGCGVAGDCGSMLCHEGTCCTASTYEKSTGLVSGSAVVCCDGDDELLSLVKCGDGMNYSADPQGANCAITSEGANNGGSACVSITCEALDCTPVDGGACSNGMLDGDEAGVDCGGSCPACPPYVGPAGPEVWQMAGVFVYDPKTFDPATYGPLLAQNHFGWVALQIVDGSTEKWPCAAEPCGTDTARGWLAAWRTQLPWVGAWGVNRANADQAAVEQEAQIVVDLLDAYDGAQAYVDFYIADAEAEYEYSQCGGCVNASDWWTGRFRSLRPTGTFEAALSSWGRTDLADVYWMAWRDHGFQFLPQTYWNDPNQGPAFAPAVGVDYAEACPSSQSAADKGLDCIGSRTDCPCWPATAIHPTIGLGWGDEPPSASDYVGSLATAHTELGATGFSIFEGQYIPADSPTWVTLGAAIAEQGIAITP